MAEHFDQVVSTTKIKSKLKKRKMSIATKNRRMTRHCLVDPEKSVLKPVSSDSKESDRAQKLDGAFFEEYADIDNKHVNLVEEAKKESLKHESHHQIGPDPYHTSIYKPPTKKKALQLYKELVYTLHYEFGKKKCTSTSLPDSQIYTYCREVLKISMDEHAKILEEVKDMTPPECYLNVVVIAGNDLEPKDANGLSDPYCMMAIINQGEGDKLKDNGNRIKKKVLRQFIDENNVKLTKAKTATLNPEWKEKFKFCVKDIQNEVFRLDLWDKDDNSVVLDSENRITQIKGFRGTKIFFKEIYQSATGAKDTLDDFMGLIEIPLRSISTNGSKAWYSLEGRTSKKSHKGKVNIKLSFSAKNPDKVVANAISDASPQEIFKSLLDVFVRYDCERHIEDNPTVEWDCTLCEEAQHLLSIYSMQHEIGNLDQTILKWEVYSSLIHDTVVPIDYLNNLLDDYRDYNQSEDGHLSEKEIENFIDSLNKFVDYSMNLLKKYRYVFSPARKARCLMLGKYLMCLLVIYNLPAFKKKFPERWLTQEIEDVIKQSTQEWLFTMEAYYHPIEHTPLTELQRMVNVANVVNADIKTGKENYEPIFDLIKVPYISIVFDKVENLLSQMLENDTKNLEKHMKLGTLQDQEMGTLMFELYLAVRDLHALKQTLPKQETSSGGVDDYYLWFQKGVVKWLDIAGVKAENRMSKAVEIDEVRVIDSLVKHSTSAVDVTSLLGQICQFWIKLEWPDPSSGYMFLAKITDIVGRLAMSYANTIFQQVKAKGFYDDIGQFDVTDQLCIMMNNMAHVLQFLDYVPTALNYETALNKLAEIHGDERAEDFRTTMTLVLECAKEDIHRQLDVIISHVDQRMQETLTDFLLKIVSFTERDVNKLCDPLLDYIDSNLVTLNGALLTQVFERILLKFWSMFLGSVKHLFTKNEKKLTQAHYERFGDVLEIVRAFFYGDGNGLSASDLLNQQYMELTELISLNKQKTELLIEKFYMERCEKQAGLTSSPLGSLTFKTFYSNGRLNVYVMNCRDLIPMDSSGSSDPYITLELKPKHMFPLVKAQKTSTQKDTLFPLFDDSFSFDAPREDCLRDGATLLFTMYDQDKFTDDDIGGEVWFDLHRVPGLGEPLTVGGFATAPQLEMFFMLGDLEGKIVKILNKRRATDSLAEAFLHKQKQRIQKITENLKKSQELAK